jgi:hypothetical protein
MSTSAKKVSVDDDSLWVHLADDRVLSIPLAWFPRLWHATPAQRACVVISARPALGGIGRGHFCRWLVGCHG